VEDAVIDLCDPWGNGPGCTNHDWWPDGSGASGSEGTSEQNDYCPTPTTYPDCSDDSDELYNWFSGWYSLMDTLTSDGIGVLIYTATGYADMPCSPVGDCTNNWNGNWTIPNFEAGVNRACDWWNECGGFFVDDMGTEYGTGSGSDIHCAHAYDTGASASNPYCPETYYADLFHYMSHTLGASVVEFNTGTVACPTPLTDFTASCETVGGWGYWRGEAILNYIYDQGDGTSIMTNIFEGDGGENGDGDTNGIQQFECNIEGNGSAPCDGVTPNLTARPFPNWSTDGDTNSFFGATMYDTPPDESPYTTLRAAQDAQSLWSDGWGFMYLTTTDNLYVGLGGDFANLNSDLIAVPG
jgi:hypothetical protein